MAFPASTAAAHGLAADHPRRLIPALTPFYDWFEPYCYPLMRFAVGAALVPIGWGKLQTGVAPVAASMTHFGLAPAGLTAWCVIAIESLGGLCIALGLFTRFWAAALAIEMAVISYVQIPNGCSRVEQFLLWGFLAFVVALRGGGRCSLDRMLGWEL